MNNNFEPFFVDSDKLSAFVLKKFKESGLKKHEFCNEDFSVRTLERIINPDINYVPTVETLHKIALLFNMNIDELILSTQSELYLKIIKDYRKLLLQISKKEGNLELLSKELNTLYSLKLPATEKSIVLMLLAFMKQKEKEFTDFVENNYIKKIIENDLLTEHILSVYFFASPTHEFIIGEIKKNPALTNNTRLNFHINTYYADNSMWEEIISNTEKIIALPNKYKISTDFTLDLKCHLGVAYFNLNQKEKGMKIFSEAIKALEIINNQVAIDLNIKFAKNYGIKNIEDYITNS